MAQTKINKQLALAVSGLHGLIYKATKGRVGGGKGSIIVLTTTGRTSGKSRERPLLGGRHPNGWIVIASFSGHDTHPAWYLNLKANPDATVQSGGRVDKVKARETEGEERAQLWAAMTELYPDYNEYQSVTDREIPVLVLEREDG